MTFLEPLSRPELARTPLEAFYSHLPSICQGLEHLPPDSPDRGYPTPKESLTHGGEESRPGVEIIARALVELTRGTTVPETE